MALESSKRAKLRQFLIDRFSLGDLKDLAFDLGVDFQALPHQDTPELARELIAYLEHREETKPLIVEVVKQRPDDDMERLFAEFLAPSSASQSTLMRALSNEININLTKSQEFLGKEYRIVGDKICSKDGEGVLMDYFTCMTNVFQSNESQKGISLLKEEARDTLFRIYRGFQDINDKADALKHAFRTWRASLYIDAVMSFEKNLRPLAEKLSQELYQ